MAKATEQVDNFDDLLAQGENLFVEPEDSSNASAEEVPFDSEELLLSENKSDPDEMILIHFVKDGFIAFGQTWYRGQELEFAVGSAAHEKTKDRNGKSWVDMASDVNGQIQRWGDHYFSVGVFVPRKGERFDDDLSVQDVKRRRAVPITRF